MLKGAGDAVGVDLLSRVTQGSWSTRVGASGTTHAGAGAADLSVLGLASKLIRAILIELRRRNGAAWYRTPLQGPWPPHIHVINGSAVGLSTSARNQHEDWKRGGNGLGGKDDGPKTIIDSPTPPGSGAPPSGSESPLAVLDAAFTWAADAKNWINLLFVLLGILLILIALYRMQKDNVIELVGVAGKVMNRGK